MSLREKLGYYRISESEYNLICDLLGRPPQGLEWALFSALWSEHCSYKSSRRHLKKFYNHNKKVLEAVGENAGVVDLGQGERIAFKMESHNHPSYIEPYQGAATGVGGILRDIFTMGARPIASADYLCFGEPNAERMPVIVDGVVRGIGGYGNCVGVPTVTGQTEFHESYNGNILVNAMSVGLFRPGEKVFLSKAHGTGNWVVYVGAKTGRDGIHGASMASESFDNDSEQKRPNVQIGDPFFEKCLIESCLEVMRENLVVAIQDMGAAGLTSSSFEMAAKGGVGFKINLDKVPLRDQSATAEDILLSESQERMLLICAPAKFQQLQAVFHRWGLDATHIGEVTAKREVELLWHNETVVKIDPDLLVEKAPAYDRSHDDWQPCKRVATRDKIKFTGNATTWVTDWLQDVRGCSREWIFNQYDQRVGGMTARDCTSDIAVQVLPDSKRALGVALGCRPYLMRLDAKLGAMDAVAYPALELSAKGFTPLAITDCLNYGNPEKSETMTEFVASIDGINEICRELDVPVVSGNVSFYNETLGHNITSTPTIGMIGLRPDVANLPKDWFSKTSEVIFVVSDEQLLTGGYGQEIKSCTLEAYGDLNGRRLANFAGLVRQLSFAPAVSASRLVGKFGLSYALARMTLPCGIGAQVAGLADKDWMMESLYQVVFSVGENEAAKFAQMFNDLKAGCGCEAKIMRIGKTCGNSLHIEGLGEWKTADLVRLYHGGWNNAFKTLA